ncbi:hypothetical protein EI94DRAFT_1699684 [Lactarius quietus]|nr:hypothetical protein EI94DRAFT_1699684 [Lactarius quietus]
MKDEDWPDVWAQLSGTWDTKEIEEASKQGKEVPPTYINVTDADAPSTLVRACREGWVHICITAQTDWKHLWMTMPSGLPDSSAGGSQGQKETIPHPSRGHASLAIYPEHPVRLISGVNEPDPWKDPTLWCHILNDYCIIVSTPYILPNTLRHGYVLGPMIGFLIFDDMHHAAHCHSCNIIMSLWTLPMQSCIPCMILGLTGSPIFGGNADMSLQTQRSLRSVIASLNIDVDPWVIDKCTMLQCLKLGPECTCIDQHLSLAWAIDKCNTFAHKGLHDFERAVDEICLDLSMHGQWSRGLAYPAGDNATTDLLQHTSDKVNKLVDTLLKEMAFFKAKNRNTVGSLVLEQYPHTTNVLNVGHSD